MQFNKLIIGGLTIQMLGAAAAADPPTYNVTNITNWNTQQLATLPFFKHYRAAALPQPNAPVDFHFVSQTSSGLTIGNTWNVFVGPDQRGVLLSSTDATTIDSFGDFHWWRTSPPASATYRITNGFDINWSGTVAGTANLPGTSMNSGEGPDMHAIIYDTLQDKIDILPDARYGYANCINNRGEIAGYAYGGPGSIVGGFRRSPDGQFTLLNAVPPGYHVQPLWINAQGVVIGTSVPGGWASAGGSSTFLLPKLFGMPLATVTDINDAGWIVGTSESWDHTERYATLWEPNGDGTWAAHDLTDRINSSGILLLRATAINNDGNIIVFGQLDEGDNGAFGTYLLTPTSTASTSCVPDIGLHPVSTTACATSVTLSVQVVNANETTSYQWSKDGTPIAPSSNPSATTSNLTLPAVGKSDAGIYDCAVTNACGSTTSNFAILDIGGPGCCPGDVNGDSVVDLADLTTLLAHFGTASGATPLDGDSDADGDVDLNDLTDLLSSFGATC